jgi:hypothetical protein
MIETARKPIRLIRDSTDQAEIKPDVTSPRRGWLSRNARRIALLSAVAVVLGGGLFTVHVVWGRSGESATPLAETAAASEAASRPAKTIGPAATDDSILSQIIGPDQPSTLVDSEADNWRSLFITVALRLLLAAGLAAILAFRGRRGSFARRNPNVAETQILMAVVASALMMIVADSAARAFGIFAAASLVRFRTNIRDPKEITVLLINLAIGLATGVGKWELALIRSGFVLATLWVLERYESGQIVRAMQLKVRTHNVAETDLVLQEIFRGHSLKAEIRELDREDKIDPLGKIVYHVAVTPRVSTDQLSEEIFASDQSNVDTVEWHQKKKDVSYAYR